MNLADILTTAAAILGASFMALLALAPILLDREPPSPRRAWSSSASRPTLNDHAMTA